MIAMGPIPSKVMVGIGLTFYIGFLHESPNLTEQEVGNLIDIAYMAELVESLGEAFESDMVQDQTSVEGPQVPNA